MEEEAPCCEDAEDTSMAAQGDGALRTPEQQGQLILGLTLVLWKLLREDFAQHLLDSIWHSVHSTDVSNASSQWHFLYVQTS